MAAISQKVLLESTLSASIVEKFSIAILHDPAFSHAHFAHHRFISSQTYIAAKFETHDTKESFLP
jgi:hypothetical protein